MASFAFTEVVEGHVGGDGVEPGVEGGFAAEFFDGPVGFGEDVLEEIVGIFAVGGHGVDEPVEFGGKFDDEAVKGGGIAFLSEPDEFLVVFVVIFVRH